MNNTLNFLFSSNSRIFLIALGILSGSLIPVKIPYFVVYIIDLLIFSGIAYELYKEYISTPYSKRFIIFRISVLILASIFLLESFILFFKTIFLGVDIKITQIAIKAYLSYFYLISTFLSFAHTAQLIKVFDIMRRSPALATISSFAILIILGAMLLTLPFATVSLERVSFIDSLFISASAACVTGLSTVDIGSYYTPLGQFLIMLLIQTGGIGIITMALSLPIIMGSQVSFTQTMTIRDLTGVRTVREVLSIARAVIVSTFAIEAVGAVLLFLVDRSIESIPLRIFSSVFHSISAFCNAGFSIFRDNLEGYSQNYAYVTVVMVLIVLGGLGFPVTTNIYNLIRERLIYKRRYSLSFHSKIVLTTTSVLIASGTLIFLILEYNSSLSGLSSFSARLINSLFMAITPRTAGFNTIPVAHIASPTILLMIVLMFIGASPSSTGGGIKTTTLATMFFSFRALIKNRENIEAFRRTIPISSVYRALNVAFISFAIIFTSIFFLTLVEKDKELIKLIFEVFSAFGTVGLSLGITPELTPCGKIIIILTMLTGRVGPLTVAIIFTQKRVSGSYRYPEDHIIIG